mgnify:CR=1 FL=1
MPEAVKETANEADLPMIYLIAYDPEYSAPFFSFAVIRVHLRSLFRKRRLTAWENRSGAASPPGDRLPTSGARFLPR